MALNKRAHGLKAKKFQITVKIENSDKMLKKYVKGE
jgi:hypothetical protein